jgi:eukaryotic-like serine/threonine-protein kinase
VSTAVDPDRDPLDLIAEEFAARVRRGERPAVSEYTAKHPEMAEDLQELLPAVAQIEWMKKAQKTVPTGPGPDDASPPKRLGDYRIVREIGRGGMGIVYQAVQESLGRRVALKVLPAAARRDPAKRARFLREAQAAARLHHTHIVPVFGVGEADGVPYYVMQFITGVGLHELIYSWGDEDDNAPPGFPRPNQWKKIARLMRSAALAVQEAHDAGILHRDLKPANLLLDPHGHVWVTDFGLAKLMDEASLTPTGDVMGTVQYMAPESLRGHSDERSDVYGLGMTLYELCCRRTPFAGTNPAEIIKQIGDREPDPPRNYSPNIPRDLETVILKSIARDRRERYRSAEAFADDLLAFTQDRAVAAKRLTITGQAIRWGKRNPAMAGLAGFSCAVCLLAALFGWVMYARAQNALSQQQELVARTTRSNDQLQKNVDLSILAFEKILESVSNGGPGGPGGPGGGPGPGGPRGPRGNPNGPNRPPDGPGGPQNAAVVLQNILEFFQQFTEQNNRSDVSPRARFQAARAYRKLGELHLLFQKIEQAEKEFAQSIQLLEQLKPEDVPDQNFELERFTVYCLQPQRHDIPLPREKREFLEQLADYGEKLREQRPGDRGVLHPLAMLYDKLARSAEASGELPLRDDYLRRSGDVYRSLRPFPAVQLPPRD